MQGRVIFPGAGYLEMARAVTGEQVTATVGCAEPVNPGCAEPVNPGCAGPVNPEASGMVRGIALPVDRGMALPVDRGLENFKTDFSRASQVDGTMGGSAAHHTHARAQARRDASHRPDATDFVNPQVSSLRSHDARFARVHTRDTAHGGAVQHLVFDGNDFNVQQSTWDDGGGASRHPSLTLANVTYRTPAASFIHLITNHVVTSLIANCVDYQPRGLVGGMA